MNNTRFATIIHVLTLLADTKESWLSSDWIAASININPVIVRKELGFLQDQGWVTSKKGKDGGSALAKDSTLISLDEVFDAVKNAAILGKKNMRTNPNCPIGKDINKQLDHIFNLADQAVKAVLHDKTLADFVQQFKE